MKVSAFFIMSNRAGQVKGYENFYRAGQGRVRENFTGQGRVQVVKMRERQGTGYQHYSTCRPLLI